MSKLIAVIACTRPEQVGKMVKSLQDCDEVRIGFDDARRGQAATINSLLYGLEDSDVVRICDDDDEAMNSRLLWEEFSTQADALLFNYSVNGYVGPLPENPEIAAADSVIACNWMVRGRLIKKLDGILLDPWKRVNTGTWAWLRILDSGAVIQIEPNIIGYFYNKRPGTESAYGFRDNALFETLRSRLKWSDHAMACLEVRKARGN